MLVNWLTMLTTSPTTVDCVPEKIPIGGIFTAGTEEQQTAFRYAIYSHNANNSKFKAEPVIDVVENDDPFTVSNALCTQLSRGIFTLVTPFMDASYETLVSYSHAFQMPFVMVSASLATIDEHIIKRMQTIVLWSFCAHSALILCPILCP